MQDNDITILITGEIEPLLEEEFAGRGLDIEVIPFIETMPLPAAALKASLKKYVDEFAFVLFTSSMAVQAVAENLETNPVSWQIFCLGHNTKKTVQKYFGASCIVATADNARELAQQLIDHGISHDPLFFCGDHRRDDLPELLSAAGIRATEIVTYTTKLTPVKTARDYDGILFFSPSAVKSFFSMNEVPPATVLFAIGPTTAGALEANSANKIIVAGTPSKEVVLENVIEYFKK